MVILRGDDELALVIRYDERVNAGKAAITATAILVVDAMRFDNRSRDGFAVRIEDATDDVVFGRRCTKDAWPIRCGAPITWNKCK